MDNENKKEKSLPETPVKKEVIKKFNSEEVKKHILGMMKFKGELDEALRKFGEDILPKVLQGNKKESEEARKKLNDTLPEIMIAMSGDTHWDIVNAFNQEYRGLAKEFTLQLIKEYDCVASSEKALATITANAYIRAIENSKRLNVELGEGGMPITENRTKYITMLSKQVDRAHRQFITSLTTLKQIKSPPIEMNIKTNNAFISQNQQINADYPPKSTKNENNVPE